MICTRETSSSEPRHEQCLYLDPLVQTLCMYAILRHPNVGWTINGLDMTLDYFSLNVNEGEHVHII